MHEELWASQREHSALQRCELWRDRSQVGAKAINAARKVGAKPCSQDCNSQPASCTGFAQASRAMTMPATHALSLYGAHGGNTGYRTSPKSMPKPCWWTAGLWITRREELGHPSGAIESEPEAQSLQPEASTSGRTAAAETFVLEIGTEELPPGDVDSAVHQLRYCC